MVSHAPVVRLDLAGDIRTRNLPSATSVPVVNIWTEQSVNRAELSVENAATRTHVWSVVNLTILISTDYVSHAESQPFTTRLRKPVTIALGTVKNAPVKILAIYVSRATHWICTAQARNSALKSTVQLGNIKTESHVNSVARGVTPATSSNASIVLKERFIKRKQTVVKSAQTTVQPAKTSLNVLSVLQDTAVNLQQSNVTNALPSSTFPVRNAIPAPLLAWPAQTHKNATHVNNHSNSRTLGSAHRAAKGTS